MNVNVYVFVYAYFLALSTKKAWKQHCPLVIRTLTTMPCFLNLFCHRKDAELLGEMTDSKAGTGKVQNELGGLAEWFKW